MTSDPCARPVTHRQVDVPRGSAALRVSAWLVAVMVATGCAGVVSDAAGEQLTSVDTWQLKMTRQGADQVRIAYTPPLSGHRQYTGANHQSDGKVMVVSLRSCRTDEECPTLAPAQTRTAAGQSRWFEVVLPYRGEQVVVDGDGPGSVVLPLTP